VSISFGPTAINTFPDGTQMTVDLNSTISDTDAASNFMALVGAGAAGTEAQFGEQWIGSNGRLYNRFWANGVGRSYSIGTLSKVVGLYGFTAALAFDQQSLQNNDITQNQFYANTGLGAIGLLSPTTAFATAPYALLNVMYPGGVLSFYSDWTSVNPNVSPENPSGSGYMWLRDGGL